MNVIILYKGRQIDYNKPIYLYRNLSSKDEFHKYSVMQNNLVVAHTGQIMLKNVEFIVRKSGLAKVRREKRKCVHAFIKGYITNSSKDTVALERSSCRITYNPYLNNTFMCEGLIIGNNSVKSAKLVFCNKNGVGGLI